MRIALITLAIAALAFIGSIVWTIFPRATTNLSHTAIVSKEPASLSNVEIELIKNQQKILDKLEYLEKQGILKSEETKEVSTNTGAIETTSTGSSGTGVVNTPTKPTTPVVKVSEKALSLLLPTANLKLEENKGIYELVTFDSLPYSTYADTRISLRVIPIDIPYDAFLKNIKVSVRDVYSINETKNFSFPSFYVNSIKPDNIVRLVTSFEKQTIAFEIPKSKFPILKALLSKKTPTTTTILKTPVKNSPTLLKN